MLRKVETARDNKNDGVWGDGPRIYVFLFSFRLLGLLLLPFALATSLDRMGTAVEINMLATAAGLLGKD